MKTIKLTQIFKHIIDNVSNKLKSFDENAPFVQQPLFYDRAHYYLMY